MKKKLWEDNMSCGCGRNGECCGKTLSLASLEQMIEKATVNESIEVSSINHKSG